MTPPPVLHLAGSYRRRVHASLARIWENVFDWEHLAHLHDESFTDCALLASGDWGWRVALTPRGGEPQQIEMHADRPAGRYISTTIEGSGVGSEIRVELVFVADRIVDVAVEFHLPEARPDRLAVLGQAYTAAYARLWHEDEAMMQARDRALAQRLTAECGTPPLDLGAAAGVRANLPLSFMFGGAPFRLVELNGGLFAHSAICPHWRGPLGDAPVVNATIRCPWHGYVFDVASGACPAHPAFRLAPAPSIATIAGRIVVGGS